MNCLTPAHRLDTEDYVQACTQIALHLYVVDLLVYRQHLHILSLDEREPEISVTIGCFA